MVSDQVAANAIKMFGSSSEGQGADLTVVLDGDDRIVRREYR
jgi:hypothetical protein